MKVVLLSLPLFARAFAAPAAQPVLEVRVATCHGNHIVHMFVGYGTDTNVWECEDDYDHYYYVNDGHAFPRNDEGLLGAANIACSGQAPDYQGCIDSFMEKVVVNDS